MKNKKIKIDGVPYSVQYIDTVETSDPEVYCFGKNNNIYKTIQISTKRPDGSNNTIQDMELTYLHELVHAILNQGQWWKEFEDEAFVEYLAKRLYELKKQNAL